jgi:hypothetical protein
MSTKREQLKGKVVALVKDFIKNEGGITHRDLIRIFGPSHPIEVDRIATILDQEKINFV